MKWLVKLLKKLTSLVYQLSLKAYALEKKIAQQHIKMLTKKSYKLREVIMRIEKEKNELEKQYSEQR